MKVVAFAFHSQRAKLSTVWNKKSSSRDILLTKNETLLWGSRQTGERSSSNQKITLSEWQKEEKVKRQRKAERNADNVALPPFPDLGRGRGFFYCFGHKTITLSRVEGFLFIDQRAHT